jgi:hypothetical protein
MTDVYIYSLLPWRSPRRCLTSESRYAVPRVSPAGKIVNFLRVNAREVSVYFTGRLRLGCPIGETRTAPVWERSCDRHRDIINLREGLSLPWCKGRGNGSVTRHTLTRVCRKTREGVRGDRSHQADLNHREAPGVFGGKGRAVRDSAKPLASARGELHVGRVDQLLRKACGADLCRHSYL